MTKHPDCLNCVFYKKQAKNHHHCSKHDFVMPSIDWQVVCADWQGQPDNPNRLPFKPEAGGLYYYSWTRGLMVQPLVAFHELNDVLISVSLRQDEKYGWVIFPRKQTHYFPPPQELVNVVIDGRVCKFQVVNEERNLAAEIIPTEDGWDEQYHSRQIFMLYSVESPTLIYDWLKTVMNIDAYIADTIAPSVFAFLEVAGNDVDYALFPDLLVYQQYL